MRIMSLLKQKIDRYSDRQFKLPALCINCIDETNKRDMTSNPIYMYKLLIKIDNKIISLVKS